MQVGGEGFLQNILHMPYACTGMVFEASACQPDHLVLHIRDLTHTRAAEECLFDGIIGEGCLRSVDDDFAVFGLAIGKCRRESFDPTLIAAPAGAGIGLVEHLVVGYSPLRSHQTLGYGTAMEENNLVLLLAVVVVPVEDGSGLLTGQRHGAHGDGGAHVDLTACGNPPVVQFTQQDAGADAQHLLHLIPAAQGQGIQMVFFNVSVNGHRDLGQGIFVLFGDFGEVRIILQVLFFGKHFGIVVRHVLNLEEQLAQVKALHIDAMLLHCNLIKTGGFESGGARADAAEIETLHAVHNPADGCKILQVLPELRAEGVHNMGLENRERHTILREHISDGELAAKGITPMLEIHLPDLIGIRLHEDGYARILQSGDGTVFVGKDRHGEDYAVILALMLFEPSGIQQALVAGLDAAVAGQGSVHGDVVIACLGDSLDHVVPCAVDEFAGHKATVAECQSKSHFLSHFTDPPKN